MKKKNKKNLKVKELKKKQSKENEGNEKQEVHEEDKQKEEKNNAVIFFDKICYEDSIKKFKKKKNENDMDKIKGILEDGYKENYYIITNISNEFYYLFEIIFFCIYLNIIEIYYKKIKEINEKEKLEEEEDEKINQTIEYIKEEKIIIKESIDKIMDHILAFMTTYEKYSIYLNFLEEEGHKTYIKSKYDEVFPEVCKDILYNNDYKSIEDLRKYLLNKKKFLYFDNTKKREMEIIKKKVNFIEDDEKNKIYGNFDNIYKRFLFNTFNENNNLFIGSKKQRVMEFFEKIKYNEEIDTNQKNKAFKEYIDNYLNIIC